MSQVNYIKPHLHIKPKNLLKLLIQIMIFFIKVIRKFCDVIYLLKHFTLFTCRVLLFV